MRVRPVLTAVFLLALCAPGCGGDNGEGQTLAPTAAANTTPPPGPDRDTPTPGMGATPVQTPTPDATTVAATPAAVVRDGDIGPHLLWEAVLGLPRLQEVCPGVFDPACIAEAERASGAPNDVIAFFEAHDMFLYAFEEMGVVDFGAVNSPLYNMGRPTPVLLNGEFGLLHVAELVPPDWKSHAEYDSSALSDFLWFEYSHLVEMMLEDGGQSFHIELPIGGCRACQREGYLNLRARFDAAGSLLGVDILPLTDETTRRSGP